MRNHQDLEGDAFDRDHFNRDMGCTEAEWLRWLPQAVGAHALRLDVAGRCAVIGISGGGIGGGVCRLAWTAMPDREIALMRIPRLAVSFAFDAVDAAERTRFMRHFDLHMQRGGG